MPRWRTVTSIAVLACTCLAGVSAQVQLRPGLYATAAEMDFAGKKTAQKNTECLTAEDLKKDFVKAVMDAAEDDSCKVLNSKWAGSKLTFSMVCESDGLKMTSTSEMTFTTESFTGVMTSKDNAGRTTVIKTTATRVGECRK